MTTSAARHSTLNPKTESPNPTHKKKKDKKQTENHETDTENRKP